MSDIRAIEPDDFIDSLGIAAPAQHEFTWIANRTALRRDHHGRFYESNVARGRILHALVRARRPRNVVEVGTGRGYGALSMAWAMTAERLDGTVYTIDLIPPHRRIEWVLQDEDRGARVERRSRESVWSAFPVEWTSRIVSLTGRSDRIFQHWRERGLPKIDLAFVDGGHDRATARRDVAAVCALSAPRFGLLADDFVDRPGYGVKAAFQEVFRDTVPLTIIRTSWGALGGTIDEGMAWLTLDDVASSERDRLAAPWYSGRNGWHWPWRPG